jgi:anti-sigma B factor antagonist
MQPFEATWRNGALHLSGELDIATEEDLLDAFVAGWEGQPEVVIDLSGLRFIDSTGILALLRLAQRVDGEVILCAPTGIVRKSLEIVGVTAWERVTVVEGPLPSEN